MLMILNIFGVDIRNSFLMENTDMEYSVTLFNAYISDWELQPLWMEADNNFLHLGFLY